MIKDSAKTIVCYGDSNTWGAVPLTNDRYPRSIRYPSVLQNILGEEYDVINEGLCGRTLVAHDPEKSYRTGITHLQSILKTSDPCTLMVIMLGTNDIKKTYGLKAKDVAEHLDQTVQCIQDKNLALHSTPKILIICPPKPVEPTERKIDERLTHWLEFFEVFPDLFEEVARKYGCEYLNAADYITSSSIDGYHLDPSAHLTLAEVVGKKILHMDLTQCET